MNPRTPDDRMFAIVSLLTVILASAYLLRPSPVFETTFVDVIPPAEFLATPAEFSSRQPTNAVAVSPEELMKKTTYQGLSQQERRQIYHAVIYFCNEEKDDRACKTYMNYCGSPCQLLVQGPPSVR